MKKSQLAQILNVSEEEISKALNALNVERNKREDFSSSVAIQVEELIQRATEKSISYKVAVQEIQAEQSIIPTDVSELLGDIPEEVSQGLQELLERAVPDIKGHMQETIQKRHAVLRRLITHMYDRNIVNQLKNINPDDITPIDEALTIEVLEGKPAATLPSGEAG